MLAMLWRAGHGALYDNLADAIQCLDEITGKRAGSKMAKAGRSRLA